MAYLPKKILACATLGVAVLAPLDLMAATPDNFQARTTRDLITLCSTDPSAPDYPMAVSFCHGFAVGAYQYYQQSVAASQTGRFVCAPNPAPTRTEAIAGFVAWAKAHPEVMDAVPVDSMFRHLAERYPCRS